MTAGEGLQHSEMFPLLNQQSENPVELFQVWLNLPKDKKFVKPHFKMLWSEDIPLYTVSDENSKSVEVNVISGRIGNVTPPLPAPDSWAAEPENEVAIWTIKMHAGAKWSLPSAGETTIRTLYFYGGSSITIENAILRSPCAIALIPGNELIIENGDTDSYLLMLQGKPINDPVVQHGPFVMNTEAEIHQAFNDYHRTQFGSWPWPRPDQVHPREKGRFAKYHNGSEEIR
jgi:hypothetical protein